MLERIVRLESLTISDYDLVEEIFDLREVDFEESLPAKEALLRELVINGLPKLKHIWNKDPHKMFSYQKLNSVNVHHCMNLKYLFPVSIAESLSELQQLDVRHCGVEEIVGDDPREANVAATFVFPRITFLHLDYLPRLKTFYRGVHTSQWQNLQSLVMYGCDKVELFASELFNFQEINEGQHDSSVQPLFMVEKVTFPSLEEIEISNSNNLKMFSMPRLLTVGVSGCALVEENFDLQNVNFEKLEISELPKLKHIWKMDPQAKLSFEELPMPEMLYVIDCDSIEEIFDVQNVNFEESHSGAITQQLQELIIGSLPKLKHIWNKDPQTELFFKSLQKVGVYHCQNLKDVFPASIEFFPKSNIFEGMALLCIEEPDDILNGQKLGTTQRNGNRRMHVNDRSNGSYASENEDDNYDSEVDDSSYASEDEDDNYYSERIRHLQKLHLESSSYKEIFSYEDDETDVENLIKLVPSSVAMD
ncbi:hypothetical protein EZV62_007018 [Acer yangbiense]|uniref:Disease resistance protein At4g27190-like leucine-rich repeats domain-containing protein n=1 Tax=Acer yangbiense TaxID=1000413 RepID=A0A5C7I843_9ROSI|nr:hypothetical protein EZV62_007018 [Acer yangbiense]